MQHIELCRDVARAFNSRFIPSRASSEHLRLPSAVLSGSSSSLHRIMSLENPSSKMSKSDDSPHATIFLDDCNDRCPSFTFFFIFLLLAAMIPSLLRFALTFFSNSIYFKIKRAVTDSTLGISFDPERRPAVSNLVSILASATDREPHEVRLRCVAPHLCISYDLHQNTHSHAPAIRSLIVLNGLVMQN